VVRQTAIGVFSPAREVLTSEPYAIRTIARATTQRAAHDPGARLSGAASGSSGSCRVLGPGWDPPQAPGQAVICGDHDRPDRAAAVANTDVARRTCGTTGASRAGCALERHIPVMKPN
jgi:hypothetical protein